MSKRTSFYWLFPVALILGITGCQNAAGTLDNKDTTATTAQSLVNTSWQGKMASSFTGSSSVDGEFTAEESTDALYYFAKDGTYQFTFTIVTVRTYPKKSETVTCKVIHRGTYAISDSGSCMLTLTYFSNTNGNKEWSGSLQMPFMGVAVNNKLYPDSSVGGTSSVSRRIDTGSGIEGTWNYGWASYTSIPESGYHDSGNMIFSKGSYTGPGGNCLYTCSGDTITFKDPDGTSDTANFIVTDKWLVISTRKNNYCNKI